MENVGVGGVVPVARDVVADHGWLGLGLGVMEVVVVVVKWCGSALCVERGVVYWEGGEVDDVGVGCGAS